MIEKRTIAGKIKRIQTVKIPAQYYQEEKSWKYSSYNEMIHQTILTLEKILKDWTKYDKKLYYDFCYMPKNEIYKFEINESETLAEYYQQGKTWSSKKNLMRKNKKIKQKQMRCVKIHEIKYLQSYGKKKINYTNNSKETSKDYR